MLLRKVRVLEDRVEKLDKKNKNSAARERRAKAKIKDIMTELKEKNLLHEELEQRLQGYKGKSTHESHVICIYSNKPHVCAHVLKDCVHVFNYVLQIFLNFCLTSLQRVTMQSSSGLHSPYSSIHLKHTSM